MHEGAKWKKSRHDEIEKMAKKIGISKTQMMLNLMDNGLDDARISNNIGIFDVIVIMVVGRLAQKI